MDHSPPCHYITDLKEAYMDHSPPHHLIAGGKEGTSGLLSIADSLLLYWDDCNPFPLVDPTYIQ